MSPAQGYLEGIGGELGARLRLAAVHLDLVHFVLRRRFPSWPVARGQPRHPPPCHRVTPPPATPSLPAVTAGPHFSRNPPFPTLVGGGGGGREAPGADRGWGGAIPSAGTHLPRSPRTPTASSSPGAPPVGDQRAGSPPKPSWPRPQRWSWARGARMGGWEWEGDPEEGFGDPGRGSRDLGGPGTGVWDMGRGPGDLGWWFGDMGWGSRDPGWTGMGVWDLRRGSGAPGWGSRDVGWTQMGVWDPGRESGDPGWWFGDVGRGSRDPGWTEMGVWDPARGAGDPG